MANLRSFTTMLTVLVVLSCSDTDGSRIRRQDSDPTSTTNRESATTKATKKPEIGPFVCPFEEGLYASPLNCRQFYTCTAGEAIAQNCPPGLFFDDLKKFCTFKNEAVCGPVNYASTTSIPLDESLLAKKCDPGLCHLPECYCSTDGTQIPGGLALEDVPQMIALTLTGGINLLNYAYFEKLFTSNRTNPNGCRILGTFFVSHDYTNYQYVQKLYAMGNEIGVNSISGRKPEEYWTKGSYENWTMEMVGMRQILETFAGVPNADILGLRGPFMKCGGNEQFDMMNDFGFVYDTTMATPLSRVPSWPFSLEYKIPFKCRAGNCPSYSYPGIWEIPINMLYSETGEGGNCAFLDQCVFLYSDEESIFTWLMENFDRHYKTNRAPLGLHLQTSWFLEKERANALSRFVDALLEKDDVYFVTSAQVLQWVIQPTTLAEIKNFEPWACPAPRPPACNLPKTCPLPHSGKGIASDIRYMQTCFPCPSKYPWVGNAKGEDKTEPDVYTPEAGNAEAAEAPETPEVTEAA